jgi:hypothetical protein
VSREQSVRSPAPSREETVEATPSAALPLAERLTALVLEARQERWARRADLTNSITSLLEGLPSHPNPGEVVPTLHRLLEEGLLDELEDGSGQSASVAATRALLALGYPHALEVSPEQLAALKHWEGRTGSAPAWSILGILFVAMVVQLAFITLGSPGIRHLFGASAAALAGDTAWVPSLRDRVESFIRQAEWPVFYVQTLLHGCGFVFTLMAGGHREGRRRAMGSFYALGALGTLMGLVQFQLSGMVGFGTFVAAGAALIAGRLLKE